MIEILSLLIYLVCGAIVFWFVVWVLEQCGIVIPARVVHLIGVLVLLLIVYWFFTGQLQPLHWPSLRR